MILDGYVLRKGDRVFDLISGYGDVIMVSQHDYSVKFGKVIRTVTGNGNIAGVKRVYWENPVLYTPTKGDTNGELTRAVLLAVESVQNKGA